ncbi:MULTISPECIES: hypothetical protein [unclassified Blastococcus]
MLFSTTFDEPPEFDVGDRVVTTDPVGPLWRRVPRGSAGVVVARTAERLIAVRFDTGRVEHVHPASLAYEQPDAGAD